MPLFFFTHRLDEVMCLANFILCSGGVPPAPLVPPVVALMADIGGGGGIGFSGSG